MTSPTPSAPAGTLVWALLASAAAVVAETALAWLLLAHRIPDVVMVYLLGVVLIAMRFGYIPSLVATALSVAAFDFFFTVPYFSFAVDDTRYVLTFVIMLFVAFVISNLTERIRRSAAAAEEREMRTARLYAMSRELAVAGSGDEIRRIARRHLGDVFASDVTVVETSAAEGQQKLVPESERSVLLRASRGVLGTLVLRPLTSRPIPTLGDVDLLNTFASQVALAMERSSLAEDAHRAQLAVQQERLRNALLSSVSHDLRTPLAVVKGAVTALLEIGPDLSPDRRQEYLETISDEASRLNRLVRNLLDMTSLEAGALRARKEWQPVEEVIGVALHRLEEQLAERPVELNIATEAALVPFDATLIEQVLVNLIENAVKYTPPQTPITIAARRVQGGVEIAVCDRGDGVPPGQEERIFEKFQRAAQTASGMGLGLTICRGIVTAHEGTIWCEQREGGGASFRFVLPRPDEAPPISVLPSAVGDP
ncbi:MAG: DUF4118 domain-containing protein [Myxococcota bacterium]|nr:DUF4118 domain-containing protein [Myxococcota bacterium]